jgi:hypothetical protein
VALDVAREVVDGLRRDGAVRALRRRAEPFDLVVDVEDLVLARMAASFSVPAASPTCSS